MKDQGQSQAVVQAFIVRTLRFGRYHSHDDSLNLLAKISDP